MKSLIILVTALVSTQGWAYQDGKFVCGSKDKMLFTYTVNTIENNGIKIPHLEIVRETATEVGVKSYSIKGIAIHFTDDEGQEVLALGNTALQLKSGRPSCAQ